MWWWLCATAVQRPPDLVWPPLLVDVPPDEHVPARPVPRQRKLLSLPLVAFFALCALLCSAMLVDFRRLSLAVGSVSQLQIKCACGRLVADVPCLQGTGVSRSADWHRIDTTCHATRHITSHHVTSRHLMHRIDGTPHAMLLCVKLTVPRGSEVSETLASRRLPCDDVCDSLKRAKDFAAVAFSDRPDVPTEVCPYPDELLVHTFQNRTLVSKAEAKIRAMISDPACSGNARDVHALVEAHTPSDVIAPRL
jgi:hypothetical protein